MNSAQAIERILTLSERKGETLSSKEISLRARELQESTNKTLENAKSYNSLSVRSVKLSMTGKESAYQIIRVMNVSTASEFLGEEFWLPLQNLEQKILVQRVYNLIRQRLTSRM